MRAGSSLLRASLAALMLLTGCRLTRPNADALLQSTPTRRETPKVSQASFETDVDVQTVSHTLMAVEPPPPRIRDFDEVPRQAMTLDEAVHTALSNNTVISGLGGRVLSLPNSVRTTMDPSIFATDPRLGTSAALSAFDTQYETGFAWNGGGRPVNSAFSAGTFGNFAQPRTLAKLGVRKFLHHGTRMTFGGVGGYDEELAGGAYAAYGFELRHPLLKGAGRQVNDIAGPLAQPGLYQGVLLTRIEHRKVQLDLEKSVLDLIQEVSATYWELYFAYRNLDAKRMALESAKNSWEIEQKRVAVDATPVDFEALARQQYFSADAAVVDAIGGTGRGPAGIYEIESRLRTLLNLPASDGKLLYPAAAPLTEEFFFDWNESSQLAQTERIEIRRQYEVIRQRRLELVAAKNLRRPQLDLLGTVRRLADDPDEDTELFNQALNGWQLAFEYRRAAGDRREKAAVSNARLRLRREHSILMEQQRQVTGELRTAFTELDRAYNVMKTLEVSREAARIRLDAESRRNAAGQTRLELVLQAQLRATQAETAYQRALVDYNHAFVRLNYARGTLFETFGVGFADPLVYELRYGQLTPSVFATTAEQHEGPTRVSTKR